MSFESIKIETLPKASRAELFKGKLLQEDKKDIFYHNFPPHLGKNEEVKGFEIENWQFSNFDKDSGMVVLALRPEGEPDKYTKKTEMPLLEFYMLNSDKAPKDMKLPLSFYVNAWDSYSTLSEQIIIDEEGLRDEAYDYLKGHRNTQDSMADTLVSIEEGKKIIKEIYAEIPKEIFHKPQCHLSEERLKQIALNKKRRNVLFGADGKEFAEQMAA